MNDTTTTEHASTPLHHADPVLPGESGSYTADRKPGRVASIIGWVIGGIPALMMIMGGVMNLIRPPFVVEGLERAGYPASAILPLGVVSIVSGLLYLVPQTAVLGAILLTGYLGGAVATHVRMGDPVVSVMLVPVYFGILLWLGLYLRDRRLRQLAPLRTLPKFRSV